MLKHYTYFLSLLLLLGFTGCLNKIPDVPIPARGPANLSGRLTLLDEFQVDSLPGNAAANLVITASGNGSETQATYDAASNTYTFANLAPGTYTITYQADGFGTLARTNYQFAGGEATALPRVYLFKTSTTKVTQVTAANKEISKTTRYLQPIDLLANVPYTVVNNDTVVFTLDSAGRQIRKIVVAGIGTVLTYGKDTSFSVPASFTQVTRNLNYVVILDSNNVQTLTKHRTRGYIAYFGDTPDVGPTNYKMSQIGYPAAGLNIAETNIPIQQFVDAGILRLDGSNRHLYIAVYGISGSLNWYGAHLPDGTGSIVQRPGVNLADGASFRADIELPAAP